MKHHVQARDERERDPPDLHDVVTQQTEILQGMLAELRARQEAPAAPVANPADPNFNWGRLVLPPETNFQVSGDGQVQRMASSLFARVPTIAGRDQHEARFVLQVVSLWPDLLANDEERHWNFQRLNVYCIVAALGWAAATAACASTTATTDFVLLPGVVLPPPQGQQRRNRRDQAQPQQQQQPAPQQQQPAPHQQQQQRRQQRPRQRRRDNPRGRVGTGRGS